MVSAEIALALPAVLVVLVLALAALVLGVDQVRCADAARIGARLAARGEPVAGVVSAVAGRSPTGAVVSVGGGGALPGGGLTMRVTVHSPAPRMLAVLGVPGCQADAVAPVELGAEGMP